jgi:hypothetical protein
LYRSTRRKEEAMVIHIVAMDKRWLNPRPTLVYEKNAMSNVHVWKKSCEEKDLCVQGDR